MNYVLIGEWKVKSVDIIITDEMKYLEELELGSVEKSLKKALPKDLKEGDILDFKVEEQLIVNNVDTFKVYLYMIQL